MRKVIRVFSILSLVVVFSIVSAQVQTVKQDAAELPYDFNVGEKYYEADGYVIKISKISGGILTLMLEDTEKNKLQTILVRGNGSVAKRNPKLVFAT